MASVIVICPKMGIWLRRSRDGASVCRFRATSRRATIKQPARAPMIDRAPLQNYVLIDFPDEKSQPLRVFRMIRLKKYLPRLDNKRGDTPYNDY
jgi:hypothetical protein